MDQFSYLTVLISIILGLGITQLLSGVGRLLQARSRVRLYWPTLAWVAILLVTHVQTWWAMFGLRSLQNWTFTSFLIVLLQPIVLYLLSALVLPEARSENALDLHGHYSAHSRWFFILAVVLLTVSLLRDLVLAGSLPNTFNVVTHGLFFIGWGIAAITRREAYHRGLVVYTVVLIAVYIAALFQYLR